MLKSRDSHKYSQNEKKNTPKFVVTYIKHVKGSFLDFPRLSLPNHYTALRKWEHSDHLCVTASNFFGVATQAGWYFERKNQFGKDMPARLVF